MFAGFHFLEPLYLLALLPLILIFWLAFQHVTDAKSWEKVIDKTLLPLLLQGENKNTAKLAKIILAVAWIISVIALADPVWEKVPRPIFQTNAARVLVLDLSNSMLIEDLKPNRLARARFKIEDILSRKEEGQVGLVVFAGDAFTASPLTRDTETIRSILKVLKPQIMPSQGSRADLGLIKAHELLTQSGSIKGEVLLIADGVSQKSAAQLAAENLYKAGHRVSVLAVGTETGGTLNFRNSKSVTVGLEVKALRKIAENGGGHYHLISNNNQDLRSVLTSVSANNLSDEKSNRGNENDELQNREWKSTGSYLLLFLLPLAALAFRRGWLLNIAVACFILTLVTQPQTVYAAENNWSEWLGKLSKNKAQRANQALLTQQYDKALELSNNPILQGSAEYKLKNYDSALQHFQNAEGEDARYNEGNTLAQQKKYQEAIAAYDKALELNPTMQDAIDNKNKIEAFLKQQQQSDSKKQSSSEKQEGNSDAKNEQQNADPKQDQKNADSKQKQQNADSKKDQKNKNGKQSAQSDGEQKQQNEQENSKENQFTKANEALDKDKKKDQAEQKEQQIAQQQEQKENKSKESKNESGQDQALSEENKSVKDNAEDKALTEQQQNALKPPLDGTKQQAKELTKEERMAAEQWLRRIPDDPGGLLRRKFRRQYNQNRRNTSTTEQPW